MNNYIGRFAPSPSGPLHLGSLVAALGSYLDAKANNGDWLLRIEGLGPPREQADAPDTILDQLAAHGFTWPDNVLYQSSRLSAYASVQKQLHDMDVTYPCDCSRKSWRRVYPGTCRQRLVVNTPHAIRLRLPDAQLTFNDQYLGDQSFHLTKDIGDFVIKRKDGLFAYQLAVVVDDIHMGITHVIRGIDLIDSTPRQQAIYQFLQAPEPTFGHLPIVVDKAGQKLSKQAHAAPLRNTQWLSNLNQALAALHQPQINATSPTRLLEQAIANWQPHLISTQGTVCIDDLPPGLQ